MRLWHYKLLPYLPDMQFKGQLRELILILHDYRDKGHTNHLLINRVMNYPKEDLYDYFILYCNEYNNRYRKEVSLKYKKEFFQFVFGNTDKAIRGTHGDIFEEWHNKEYLRINMANLYEKYKYGVGKSKIKEEEWKVLLSGYSTITNEEYII